MLGPMIIRPQKTDQADSQPPILEDLATSYPLGCSNSKVGNNEKLVEKKYETTQQFIDAKKNSCYKVLPRRSTF